MGKAMGTVAIEVVLMIGEEFSNRKRRKKRQREENRARQGEEGIERGSDGRVTVYEIKIKPLRRKKKREKKEEKKTLSSQTMRIQ